MRAIGGVLLAVSAAGVAQAEDAPVCTDRPAKANAVCTVPAGQAQIETSGVGWSLTKFDGTRSELLTIGASFAKIGLSERSDLQIGFTPYAELRIRNGVRSRVSGVGDVVVRYKHRLTGSGAAVQVAAIPFMKLPTAADGLGNGRLEGGLAIPISFALSGAATLTLGPELDVLADADGDGRHPALVNLVNVSVPVAPRLTVVGELWTSLNFDPDGTAQQASLDVAVAYAVSGNLQLDVGANLGLTRETADFEGYAGISLRF
jgi:hypothetical protein